MDNVNSIISLFSAIIAALSMGVTAYLAFKKGKPEIKKLELEGESEIVDAAHLNLEGAEVSARLLMERIKELKEELDKERRAREEEAKYFRRRIRELDREVRDYRNWAAKLAKQVIESGKEPAPFISTMGESDPMLASLNRDKEETEKRIEKREQVLREETEIKK